MCMIMCMKSMSATVRTNIVLDSDLVTEAQRLTGIPTRRALVREALRTLVESKRRLPLAGLRGKIKFAADYDHKKARSAAR
jgi:Arc/MetJ family transcription regulator